jgi:Ca2+-binding RTX toxin-like protein
MPAGTIEDDIFIAKSFGKGGITDPSGTDHDLVRAPFDFTLPTNLENLELINNAPMLKLDFGGGDVSALAQVQDPTEAIVGSWKVGTGAVDDLIVITFLQDGTYLLVDDGDEAGDPTGHDGFERGTYTWDADTGALTFMTAVNRDGEWGLSTTASATVHTATLTVVGNGATLAFPDDPQLTAMTRIVGGGLIGSWYGYDATGEFAVTYVSATKYVMVQEGPNTDPSGHDGIEIGSYTWNSATGAFTSQANRDTNGDWGLAAGTGALNGTTATATLRAANGTGNGQANTLTGDGGANQLSGLGGNDVLKGNGGADKLLGGVGADKLYGGVGKDVLNGGGGPDADKFYFDVSPTLANADSIAGWDIGKDKIMLDDDIFTALGTGTAAGAPLAAAKFYAGTAAHDADDRIIYDSATGRLYYDADGNGHTSVQQLIATVGAPGHPTLVATDFKVVA